MIEARLLTKKYDDFTAVDNMDLTICDGTVFALVGTNGAGKSTFMKMLTGIIRPSGGTVCIDGEPVYENPEVKRKFFYISDDQYYPPNVKPSDLADFFVNIYPDFDRGKALKLIGTFGLPPERKVNAYSKGMKKLLSAALGLAAGTEYLFCDETFDGIDPIMRYVVKTIISEESARRNFTVVINSHNLRELQDLCTHAALIHKGRILLTEEVNEDNSLEDIYIKGMAELGYDIEKIIL